MKGLSPEASEIHMKNTSRTSRREGCERGPMVLPLSQAEEDYRAQGVDHLSSSVS